MARKLKTEIDTPAMGDRVLEAFEVSRYARRGHRYNSDFEHGQWWITSLTTGAQWSVVDATGYGSVDGFDFERVTEGEED